MSLLQTLSIKQLLLDVARKLKTCSMALAFKIFIQKFYGLFIAFYIFSLLTFFLVVYSEYISSSGGQKFLFHTIDCD